jgi:hypothetical protein
MEVSTVDGSMWLSRPGGKVGAMHKPFWKRAPLYFALIGVARWIGFADWLICVVVVLVYVQEMEQMVNARIEEIVKTHGQGR